MFKTYAGNVARKQLKSLKEAQPMNKKLAVAGITAAVAITTLTGLGIATAATQNTSTNNRMSNLVDAVATKFKLNKAEVQAVFDAEHTKAEAEHEADVKTKLAQLVKDGKLTQAQADAITAKRAELQKNRETNRANMSAKTHAERKTLMDTERTALNKWFSDNNISTDYRYLVGGGRDHRGPGDPRDSHDDTNQRATDSNFSSNAN